LPTATPTIQPTTIQATGRQRGDSSRPVGNNNSSAAKALKMGGMVSQLEIQASHAAPGTLPGSVSSP
jgi:hypothetical protein